MQNPYSTKERETETGSKVNKGAEYMSSAIREEEQKIRDVFADAEKRLKQGEEQLRKVIANVDKQLHDNPWPIVGGVAAGCLLLGFLFGTTRRSS